MNDNLPVLDFRGVKIDSDDIEWLTFWVTNCWKSNTQQSEYGPSELPRGVMMRAHFQREDADHATVNVWYAAIDSSEPRP